ncbi:pyridoxamine 5'-phosphate oxidase family protein [Rhizobium sp. 18065]|uniref:FAD-binding oxidoreductase n=1 Tax=Rhizobium sp. 18065 TaxID=2681411 RepID=UPI00135CC60E|nr:pyridoxamine 5'-phosphate oxidase family protein [Rhizobium sp. 18065]
MLDKVTTRVSPWHDGELQLQRHAGVAEHMDTVGRKVVRRFLLDQHRKFYPLLPFIAIGAVDADGTPWATIRSGQPGFLHSPDPLTLDVEAAGDPGDPAEQGMKDGDPIGMLSIDLITRRRNRMNGTIRRSGSDRFSVSVEHSYGNCPRYIQNRQFAFVRDPAEPFSSTALVLDRLDDRSRAIIEAADTFFVASYVDRDDEGRQVDVSHRGGRPGFVRIDADGGLTIPDFNGNLFFNTLGNFLVNPRAGMLFVDHETGDVLQLSGRVQVILDSPEIAAFEGAERLWRVLPDKVVLRGQALPLRWTFAEDGMSPSSLMTGSWSEAQSRLQAAAKATTWRRFRIEGIVEESETIRSLHLAPTDGQALIPHLAGQHLPVRIADGDQPIRRSYTISSAPSDGYYRLSVKREGRVSTLLHGLQAGDEIEALAPAGAFTIDAMERRRPAVLLAAGIGITPLLSMLRYIVHEGDRTRHRRPIWLFRSSRRHGERAFDREIAELVDRGKGSIHDVRVLGQAEPGDEGSYDAAGRIDVEMLKAHLPFADYDFYLCGPASFMQSVYDGLRGLNIVDERLHAEAFGPSGVMRDRLAAPAVQQAATAPVRVIFTQSAKEARWKTGDGSLLDLAEQRSLSPAYGCRAGHCGDCRTRVIKGSVSYFSQPSYPVARDDVLLCCSVPAEGGDLHLDI